MKLLRERAYRKALNSCRNDNKYLFGKLHDVEEKNRRLDEENQELKKRVEVLQKRIW